MKIAFETKSLTVVQTHAKDGHLWMHIAGIQVPMSLSCNEDGHWYGFYVSRGTEMRIEMLTEEEFKQAKDFVAEAVAVKKMTLPEYITEHYAGNQSAFARAVDVSRAQVSRWIRDGVTVKYGRLWPAWVPKDVKLPDPPQKNPGS